MTFKKKDDSVKKVHFLTEAKIKPIIESILESAEGTHETVQVQISIKGYENRKDPKMTKDIYFPYRMRRDADMVIIGNEKVGEIAKSINCPFLLATEFIGNDEETKKKRELSIKTYKYILLSEEYNKGFVLREILKKRKLHFLCPDANKLPTLYKDLLNMYRLKVRDWFSLSFPIGHSQMNPDELVSNAMVGIQTLADSLKKGPQNIKECFIKRTTGSPLKIN